jgi:hypothetical protein
MADAGATAAGFTPSWTAPSLGLNFRSARPAAQDRSANRPAVAQVGRTGGLAVSSACAECDAGHDELLTRASPPVSGGPGSDMLDCHIGRRNVVVSVSSGYGREGDGSMATPDGAVELGRYMYLFKSQTNSTDVVISAHGGFVFENASFKVPGALQVKFYSAHGQSVQDPGTFKDSNFVENAWKAKRAETVVGGMDCHSYILSKYQGAHAGESHKETLETYQELSAGVADMDTRHRDNQNSIARFRQNNPNNPIIPRLESELSTSRRGASVLTIRNRVNIVFGVPLKDALKALVRELPGLETVHCMFCRSPVLQGLSKNIPTSLGQTMVLNDAHVAYRK